MGQQPIDSANRTIDGVKLQMYRSGSSDGSCRQMGHPAPTWAMHGKRQNVMHGPAGLTQTEKNVSKIFFKLEIQADFGMNQLHEFLHAKDNSSDVKHYFTSSANCS